MNEMYYLFLALLPVALGQMRADVRFGEDNERFDLSPLVQEGAYEQWSNVVGVRRLNGESNGQAGDATSKFFNALRRFREDFRQNSNLNEDAARKSNDDNDTDNEEMPNDERRKFSNYLRENQVKRRSGDTQDDRLALMPYGVPVVMKLKGIMQVPLSR